MAAEGKFKLHVDIDWEHIFYSDLERVPRKCFLHSIFEVADKLAVLHEGSLQDLHQLVAHFNHFLNEVYVNIYRFFKQQLWAHIDDQASELLIDECLEGFLKAFDWACEFFVHFGDDADSAGLSVLQDRLQALGVLYEDHQVPL